MVLTRSQYENMSKEELIQELTDINSSFANEIITKLSSLLEKFNEFVLKYDNVNSELKQCKTFNSHLMSRTIQLECNALPNSQHRRRETIELNPVPTDITEDVLEENVCKALSLTGVNIFPNDFHACHRMKRSDRVVVKFKCRMQKNSIMYKRKNLGNKSQELVIQNFLEDFLLVRVFLRKTNSLRTNSDNLKVPGRFTLPGSLIML